LLLLVCVAQLMVILDITAVNAALPQLANGLHINSSDIGWTITSYSLIFGSLLLLGGRAADLIGRKRMFLTGLASSPPHRWPPPWRAARQRCSLPAPARGSARRCSPPPPCQSSWPRSPEAMSALARWVPGAQSVAPAPQSAFSSAVRSPRSSAGKRSSRSTSLSASPSP
jgi:MFS family permease